MYVIYSFKVLCNEQKADSLIGIIKGLQLNEAKFVDNKCDWSAAKNWAQWWMRSNHLAMLHKDYSTMNDEVWDKCPSTTNAVERRNAECKQKQPIPLKMAMVNIYNLDKSVCAKHIAAECGVSISHRDKSETARRSAAQTRQRQRMAKLYPADPKALKGPPDRACHFDQGHKRYNNVELVE